MHKRMSNLTKDKLVIVAILILIIWIISGAVYYILAQDRPLVEEYQNRETIIRAETEEDREWNEIWRSQYREQYGIEYYEGEE